MTTIVTRAGKGSPLTHTEVDTNFTNLNTAKLEAGAIALGSAATPSISFTGDTNTGIYSPGADQVAISTNGVQRINIEADGDINIDGGGVFYDATNNRLAIGTTGPQGNLHIADATRANIIIKKTGLATIDNSTLANSYDNIQLGAGGSFASYNVETTTADTHIGHNFYRHSDGNFKYKYTDAVARIKFNTNVGETIFDRAASGSANTNITFLESMRLDSSGRLLVGTPSSSSVAGAAAISQIVTGANIGLSILRHGDVPILALGATGGSPATVVTNGQPLGEIRFAGADGTDVNTIGASITALVDGTPGADDLPTRLVFSTTPDNGSSPTSSPPAMTIKSSQEVLIGTSTITANGGILQLKSGITFPATAVAASDANTLDDYEEGTWLPALKVGGSDTGITYSERAGQYIKIGKLVYIRVGIYLGTHAGLTGNLTITTLPFTPQNVDSAEPFFRGASAAGFGEFAAVVTSNSTTLLLRNPTTFVDLTHALLAAGTKIYFTGCYPAA